MKPHGRTRQELEEARRQIWWDFGIGLALSLVLVLTTMFFESTPAGRDFGLMVHTWLERRLIPSDPPVTVVDISELEKTRPGDSGLHTPREPLIELIQAIAAQGPKAIGIDIDFSESVDEVDPVFFEYCLRLRKGDPSKGNPPVTIFLGIFRTQALPADEWLADVRYKDLAASLMIPIDLSRMLDEISSEKAGARGGPSMAAALAMTYGTRDRWTSKFPLILEKVSERKLKDSAVKVREFPVDYSALPKIRQDRLITMPRESFDDRKALNAIMASRRAILNDRMVLLGDAVPGKAADQVDVPSWNARVPGVFVHACAAYTLAIAPLYTLKEGWRLFVDLFISVVVFLFVAEVRLHHNRRESTAVAAHRLLIFSIACMVALVLFIGLGLVNMTRIMWDDFLLISIALMVHPAAERGLKATRHWLGSAVPEAWDRLIHDKEGP